MEGNPHGVVGNLGNLRGMLEGFHCLGGLRLRLKWRCCLVAGRSGDILEGSEIGMMCRYFLVVGSLILVSSQPASVKKRNWCEESVGASCFGARVFIMLHKE